MNRIDRLFAITVLMQARRRVRAAELASLFEVSERTIYRDIQALSESGIPIISAPGEGYELPEDFYLPTVQLSLDEARALFLSAEMFKAQASGALQGSIASALAKVAAALPENVAKEAARLVEILRFFVQPGKLDFEDPRLLNVQQAIHEQRVVWIRYHSYAEDKTSEREIEPEGLHYHNGAWYLSAYCRLRREARSFRLSRVEELRLLDEVFHPRILLPSPPMRMEVRVRFKAEALRWVRERQHYTYTSEETDEEGAILTYEVTEFRELRPWLLSWGTAVELLSPPEVRAAWRAELEEMLDKYKP